MKSIKEAISEREKSIAAGEPQLSDFYGEASSARDEDVTVHLSGDHYVARFPGEMGHKVEISLACFSRAAGGMTHGEAMAKARELAEADPESRRAMISRHLWDMYFPRMPDEIHRQPDYQQSDEDAALLGCAEEPEFMWLGQPAEDGARTGPLSLEQYGVSGNNWRVVLSVDDDRVTQRVYVADGIRSDIDAKTRAWVASLTELVPKW